MAIADVFWRKSPDLKLAEQWLREREDEVFKLQPGEEHDLAAHVRADLPRHELLQGRIELNRAFARQASNRNLAWTITGFGIVLAKLFGGPEGAVALFKFLVKLLVAA